MNIRGPGTQPLQVDQIPGTAELTAPGCPAGEPASRRGRGQSAGNSGRTVPDPLQKAQTRVLIERTGGGIPSAQNQIPGRAGRFPGGVGH